MEKAKDPLPWLVTWLVSLGQTSFSLPIPAFPAISEDLHFAPHAMKSTLTVFLLGFGISQLIYGPLSDKFGRKPPLLFGIGLFCLTSLINVWISSLQAFFILRFLQGVGTGSIVTLTRAILRDRYEGAHLASVASHLSMGFAVGLGLSPLIGAYLQIFFGWRSNFLALCVIGIILFIYSFLQLPETSPKPLAKANWKEAMYRTLTRYYQIIVDIHFWKYLLAGVFAYSVVIPLVNQKTV